MKPPFMRSPYNYDLDEASNSTAIGPGGPSLTVQSMSEDADLNVMLKRFKITGQMPTSVRLPSFGDFSGITDFRSALDAIRDAEDNFMEIPPDVRARFQNNPQLLLEFVSDPVNIGEVKKLFGEENAQGVSVAVSGGGAAESGRPGGSSGGGAASSGDAGAGGSQRFNEPGDGRSGPKA